MSWFNRAISIALPAVPRPLVRVFSRRYIAGSRLDDAIRVSRELARDGAMATLDILGEFVSCAKEAEANTRAYEELIERVRREGLTETHVSIKLSALGLLIDEALCLENMRRLGHLAREAGNFIRIDMEDSPCTNATLRIYRALRSELGSSVGVVLQSRLRRTLDDVGDLAQDPLNVRLCKGIYIEPRAVAYRDAEIIRRNFTLALERLFEKQAYVGIATHDEILVWDALRLIRKYELSPQQYEFQMLLGVDEELRRILIESGHRMRIYVPYGEQWYSYSVRRLRENPEIAGYALKAMFQRG